jgi:hypothetical protein
VPESSPKPRRRRWLWPSLAVSVVLLPALTCVGVYVGYQRDMDEPLREAIAELDQKEPHWRMPDIEAARASISDAENSARRVEEVVRNLPENWPTDELHGLFKGLKPDHRLEWWQAIRLHDERTRLRSAVDKARELERFPRGKAPPINWALDYVSTPLPYAQQLRRAVYLLQFDARWCAERGDVNAALRSCHAALNVGRSLGDEPIAISQLVRLACRAIACEEIERSLAQGQADEAVLAPLQEAVRGEESQPLLLIAARGERASLHGLLEAIESGRVSLRDLGSGTKAGTDWDRVASGFYGPLIKPGHAQVLGIMTGYVDVARRPPEEWGDLFLELDGRVHGLPQSPAKLLVPALSKVGEAARRQHAQLRSLGALFAVERYRLKHGRWPDNLACLVPDYLPAVPTDPYDAQPLRYARLDDGVVVYSVGLDAEDDGGHLNNSQPAEPGFDQGYRLWDPAHRRQPAESPSPDLINLVRPAG